MFHKIQIIIVLLTHLLLGFSTNAASKNQPNIVFVMIDDCSAVEFSCYATISHPAGNKTPIIDGLAEEGLRFQTCWATPLCMPTRALLVSGKYGNKTGVYGNKLNKPNRNFASIHKPISKVLQENGYRTAISGKWHLPGDVEEKAYGWDDYSLLGCYYPPKNKEYTWDGLWFSWKNAAYTFHDKAIIGKNNGKYPAMYWNGAVIENGKLLPSHANTYAPDLNQKFAIDFIKQKHAKPFFLYYAMVLPHDPWLATPDNTDPTKRTKPGFPNLIQRTEFYMDELISTLKEQNLYENTLLVFTADNATLRNGKGNCSELGVRVPLIIAGGPLKRKGTTDALVDFADFYPTLLDLAGIENRNNELDGVSFNALLQNKRFKQKPYIFSYLDMQRTIRNKKYTMDGTGGIWQCSKDGNILDYTPVQSEKKASKLSAEFLNKLEKYPLPTPEVYGEKRINELTRNVKWPSSHYSMTTALKDQDEWMNNPRRMEE